MVKKLVLKNGLKLLYKHVKSNIITVNVSVLVGSNHEPKGKKGISHLLEHMVFEGTKTRSTLEISKEIERFGGEFNAYTTNEKTNYYVKIHRKFARKAIEILADIIINPIFEEYALKKEKGVVDEEIDMINDDPKQYQWVLFMKKLFDLPVGSPTYGLKKDVNSITRKELVDYHKKAYCASNMIISIVGDCDDHANLVNEYFGHLDKGKILARIKVSEVNKRQVFREKRQGINQRYLILGYKTPNRRVKESYILDVISSILAKGQSGWLFDEIRTKRGLTYDLGVFHGPVSDYGFFAFYTSASMDKITIIEKIFFEQVKKLEKVKKDELTEAQSFIEGNIALKMEDSHMTADTISFMEECGDYRLFDRYMHNIRKVTINDVRHVAKRFLGSEYTKIVLE